MAQEGQEFDAEYYAPRRCLREPIPELFQCAWKLDLAVTAHLEGNAQQVAELISDTNTQVVRNYVESLWGKASRWPEQVHYKRLRKVEGLGPRRKDDDKSKLPRETKLALVERDGFQCRYCGIPVIPAEVREAFSHDYPALKIWATGNASKHAGFQALWLQYDHILPVALGGGADLENMVICCSGCNYCKWHYHLDELGLMNPLDRPIIRSSWDGLTRYFGGRQSWRPKA